MKSVHDLLNRSFPVPPMDIQDVDIRRTKLFETGFNAHMYGLDVVSSIVNFGFDAGVTAFVIGRVLWGGLG